MKRPDAVSVITEVFMFRKIGEPKDGFLTFANGRGEEIYLGERTVEHTSVPGVFHFDDSTSKDDLVKFIKN